MVPHAKRQKKDTKKRERKSHKQNFLQSLATSLFCRVTFRKVACENSIFQTTTYNFILSITFYVFNHFSLYLIERWTNFSPFSYPALFIMSYLYKSTSTTELNGEAGSN